MRKHVGVVVAVALLGACGSKAPKQDDCAVVQSKLRTMLATLMRDAGKTAPPAQIDADVASFCVTRESSASDQQLFACVLAAADQAATVACIHDRAGPPKLDLGKRPPDRGSTR